MSCWSLREVLLSLRDLMQELAGLAGADEALSRAYSAARQRAYVAGEKIGGWAVTCPWRVVDLVEVMSRRIEALAGHTELRGGEFLERPASA
jgi:hypothetical protein